MLTTTSRLRALLFLLICFLAAGYPVDVWAQKSVENVIERYKAVNFPSGDTSSLSNVVISGRMRLGSMEFETKAFIKEEKLRMEMAFHGEQFVQAVNEDHEWNYNPLIDKVIIKPKSDGYSNEFDLRFTDLLKVDGKNYKAEILNQSKSEDTQGILVKVDHNDRSNYFVIDDQEFVVLKNYRENEQPSFFSDYKQVGSMQFPHYFKFQVADKLIEFFVRDIDLDVDISDSMFTPPNEKEMITSPEEKSAYEHAKVFMNEGNFDQAIEYYDLSIRIDEKNSKAYNNRGFCHMQQGSYYKAISDFNRAVEIDPGFSTAYSNLGLAKFYLKDYENALIDFGKSIEVDSGNARAYGNRSMVWMSIGDFEQSLSDIQMGIDIDKDIPELHYNKGVIYHELQDYKQSLEAFQYASSLGYNSPELNNYIGNCLYGMQQYDSALIYYQKAVHLNDKNPVYYINMGLSNFNLEHYEQALEQYQKAEEMDPENDEIHNYLGITNYYLQNYKRALQHYNRAIDIDDSDAVLYDNRALTKEQLNDFKGAILDYNHSIELYPNDAVIFYKRGLAKINNGQRYEGCLDLYKAEEMGYDKTQQDIIRNCE